MDVTTLDPLREFLGQALREAGEPSQFGDDESLFASGRLDSLALTQLVLYLEEHFRVDFGALDFSADLVDSVDAIKALLLSRPAAHR